MPIKKSAFKSLRQTKKRTIRNKKVKANLIYLERKLKKLISVKKSPLRRPASGGKEARDAFLLLQKALDKAAQRKIIKKNTAARKKSRLNKLIAFNQK